MNTKLIPNYIGGDFHVTGMLNYLKNSATLHTIQENLINCDEKLGNILIEPNLLISVLSIIEYVN